MEKDLQEIAKILSFDNSFFEEVERFGGLGFYEIDLISGKMKVSTNFKRLFNLPEKSCYGTEVFFELSIQMIFPGLLKAFMPVWRRGEISKVFIEFS